MFKRFIAVMMIMATLSGCSVNVPFIGSANAENEGFVIEDYYGQGTMTMTKVSDDNYLCEVVLSEEGAEEYFEDYYGEMVTGMTMTLTLTKDGYDYVVADLKEQGYEMK